MQADYQLRIYDTTGVLQYVSDLEQDVRTLVIMHQSNTPSTLTLGLYELSDAVKYLSLDSLIEVRRRVQQAGLAWYTEFIGFQRTPERQITSTNERIFTAYARGLLDLINRRSIRYYADSDGSAKGPAPADDVIKEYVLENAGNLATTANRRVTDGVTPGLTVAANLGAAPTYTGQNAWKNLLSAVRDIGQPNQVDVDVVWLGGITWQFRTYYPQLGTDRRAGTSQPMVFSPGLGNMSNPVYTQSRTEEITSALVLGPGEGVLRDTTLRTSIRISDSPWNLIELDVDASSEDIGSALIAKGDAVLYDKRPAVNFTFDAIQQPNSCYAKHYFLGDVVTGSFSVVSASVKINAITLDINQSGETIKLDLVEVPA